MATLTSDLVAKKGQATPAVKHELLTSPVVAEAPSAPVAPTPATVAEPVVTTDTKARYYKALTIKLDKAHYDALKSLGIKLDKKSQQIFELALKDFLAKHNAI